MILHKKVINFVFFENLGLILLIFISSSILKLLLTVKGGAM
jgi:hypothetical protein